jgi:hypothetical protein
MCESELVKNGCMCYAWFYFIIIIIIIIIIIYVRTTNIKKKRTNKECQKNSFFLKKLHMAKTKKYLFV